VAYYVIYDRATGQVVGSHTVLHAGEAAELTDEQAMTGVTGGSDRSGLAVLRADDNHPANGDVAARSRLRVDVAAAQLVWD
jgi:hypothetical protein